MKIFDLTREDTGRGVRVAATYRFEHCDLPELRVFFSCDGPAANDLMPSPDAFLLIGLPLACWMEEQRVQVDGSICTALRENLADAMRLYAHWHARAQPVTLEPTAGFRATRPLAERRTAMLLSGGVDSLATLRANLDAYPRGHPDAVRDALFLRGCNTYDRPDGGDGALDPARARAYERKISRLQHLAEHAGYELTVLDTNARSLYPDWESYRDIGWAAGMLAAAHVLGGRITDVLISSTGYGVEIPGQASHPLLDGLYSTAAVRAHHALPFVGRFEKLEHIAAWPEGLDALDVCLGIDPPADGPANCGVCNKCIRTMLGLEALGRLGEAREFPRQGLDAAEVEALPLEDPLHVAYLAPLQAPLVAAGRTDLADALQRRLDAWNTPPPRRTRLGRALGRAMGRG